MVPNASRMLEDPPFRAVYLDDSDARGDLKEAVEERDRGVTLDPGRTGNAPAQPIGGDGTERGGDQTDQRELRTQDPGHDGEPAQSGQREHDDGEVERDRPDALQVVVR